MIIKYWRNSMPNLRRTNGPKRFIRNCESVSSLSISNLHSLPVYHRTLTCTSQRCLIPGGQVSMCKHLRGLLWTSQCLVFCSSPAPAVGYHHMCRFFAEQIFHHPRIRNLTYYM